MKLHGNARTCPKRRKVRVERIDSKAWSVTAATEAAAVSERTAYRWLQRWRGEGERSTGTTTRTVGAGAGGLAREPRPDLPESGRAAAPARATRTSPSCRRKAAQRRIDTAPA